MNELQLANGLRTIISGKDAVIAPAALTPLMAQLARQAGFKALYLSGGSLGWLMGISEANITLNDMIQAGIDIRTVSDLPLILDAAGGWGDPMHMHRTIAMAERAGFSGIEIEDQVLPKRAHHHIDRDYLIPTELMESKIQEAVRAKQDEDFVVIGRTDAAKVQGIDEAMRRAERYKQAGADMLFVYTRSAAEMKLVGERFEPPLMIFAPRDGTGALTFSLDELAELGYRVVGVPVLPLLSLHKAVRSTYEHLARLEIDPAFGTNGADRELKRVHETIGLEYMLDIERRTLDLS